MVRSAGAQIGLLAFTLAIVAGIHAGNSVAIILGRALLIMVLGSACGQLAAWTAKAVLRDHLQRRKSAIDRQHLEALQAADGAAAPATSENLT